MQTVLNKIFGIIHLADLKSIGILLMNCKFADHNFANCKFGDRNMQFAANLGIAIRNSPCIATVWLYWPGALQCIAQLDVQNQYLSVDSPSNLKTVSNPSWRPLASLAIQICQPSRWIWNCISVVERIDWQILNRKALSYLFTSSC